MEQATATDFFQLLEIALSSILVDAVICLVHVAI